MPVSISTPTESFMLYYALPGNNNDKNSSEYRSNNPWQIAKKFCEDLVSSHQSWISKASSLDDSVFQLTLKANRPPGSSVEAIAQKILADLAAAIAPAKNGDRIVAVVPDGGLLKEIVHHTP